MFIHLLMLLTIHVARMGWRFMPLNIDRFTIKYMFFFISYWFLYWSTKTNCSWMACCHWLTTLFRKVHKLICQKIYVRRNFILLENELFSLKEPQNKELKTLLFLTGSLLFKSLTKQVVYVYVKKTLMSNKKTYGNS